MKYCKYIPLLSLIFYSCNADTGNVKMEYYSKNQIKSIKHYKDGIQDGEAIFFYPSGNVKGRISFFKGNIDGYAYNFYPSGCLEKYRRYKNGKEVGTGEDYYDHELPLTKSFFQFNDSGRVVYKVNYNIHGQRLSEEGKEQPDY